MKNLLITLIAVLHLSVLYSQCNVIATAMANPASCNGSCDGSITYVYQNTGAPGVPYIVTLTNATSGQVVSTTTYTQEIQTIPFTGLCAGAYSINIQGQGCSFMTTAYVAEPSAITLYANTTNPSPGQNNGSISLVAQGGASPYTYSINGTNYQSSPNFTALAPGTYTGYVKDANGCIQTVSCLLNNTAQCLMVVTANPTLASCTGSCDASIWYAFTGNMLNPPYFVQLQNTSGQPIQSQTVNALQGSFTSVCPGNYTVQVSDANGCSANYQVSVGSATPPIVTAVSTSNAAFGTYSGTAVVSVAGGTVPFSYSLNGGASQSSNTFNNLASGFYVVTVVDANGCQGIYCFMIQETQACGVVLTSNSSPASCYGTSSGSITYAYTNAYGPVSVVLQNTSGATIQTQTFAANGGQGTFSNIPVGTYSVTVTDASGCSFTNNVIITGPSSQLALTATSIPSASGMNNGVITATVTGGTAPYQFALGTPNNWQSSNVFTGLAPGGYIIYVQDANGCTAIYCVQLTQITNCQQAITAMASPLTCAGMNNGEVTYTFTSSGVGAPYSIALMTANNTVQTQTTNNTAGVGTFSNVASGVYTVQLTSANGCVSTTQVYVDQPNPLQISNVSVTNATTGQANGSAIVTVMGGTAPYTFVVNNGAPGTSNHLTGLSAGVQILEVEDANGCTAIYCFIVNETSGCQPIVVTATQVQSITCYGSCNAALIWTYTGGSAPGLYTVSIAQNGNVISTNSLTVGAYQGTIGNLCAGQYAVTVTDPNGCIATYNLAITQPAPLSLTAVSSNASSGSSNGSITANASGGTGVYQYSLNGTTWQASNVFSNLAAGVYVVYVKDANGCSQLYTVQVATNSSCYITVTATQGQNGSCPGSCNEGISYAYAATNGVGPYTVTLTDQSGNVLTQTQNSQTAQGTFTGLCGGAYVITVTSANGCYGVYTVFVQTPSYATISTNVTHPTPGLNDGAFTMNITGGTPSYEFSIDDQLNWTSNPTFTNLGAGVYIVYSRDANTCTLATSVKLGQSTAAIDELEASVIAYPNPAKEYFVIEGVHLQIVSFKNVNGQEVVVPIQELSNGQMLDLSSVAKGIYFANIALEGKARVVKVVKE